MPMWKTEYFEVNNGKKEDKEKKAEHKKIPKELFYM